MTLHRWQAPDGAAQVPEGTVVYAIGDVHGRCDLLEELHHGIEEDARLRAARRRLLVYLGDYVSRGENSRRAVELVMTRRPASCAVIALKGNHEDLLLRFLDGDLEAGRHWFDYDGLDTLGDYGVRRKGSLESLRERFAAALPREHLAFLRGLPVSHDEGGYRFVHAGVRPGVPLGEQSERDQMWIRSPFIDSRADFGAMVVHGHCVSERPELRQNRIGIDTGAWRTGVLTCLALEGRSRAFLQTGA